jgi:uncharacterized protein
MVGSALVVSPTDLTKFLACRHLTALDQAVALGERPPPPGGGEALEVLFRRGIAHEQAYLDRLRGDGRRVVAIDTEPARRGPAGLREAEAATVAAMAAGADVVYQGTFFDGVWRGHADFLLRRDDRPGAWAWSYDVADTKLARRLAVPAILQMATYAERLTTLQGVAPERLVVVTGDAEERPYLFADCVAYARLLRAELLAFLDGRPPTTPEPVAHCGQCRWQTDCRAGWRAADDLGLVAGMRRRQAQALRRAGITTVRLLAAASPGDVPPSVGRSSADRLTRQARLQVAARGTGARVRELLPPEPGRGLALLPAPSPGDVFFDMEGDPFAGESGLEYLFGLVDRGTFTGYWATDPADEKEAFENLVDHLVAAWEKDPGMHVYHYAPYEPTRLKALSGRYDTRCAEVDRLLRGNRLVDLYTVVKQGVRVSAESYSLKQLEPFYWGRGRGSAGVSDALGSVVAFETWLLERDQALLDDIRDYNEEDCRSTQALRDWLEGLRLEGGGDPRFPRPEHGDGAAPAAVEEEAEETARLRSRLLEGLPEAAASRSAPQQARWLLAALLDWHRREALPQWWQFFHRRERTDAELQADTSALGGVGPATLAGASKQSALWRMEFEPQDTKVTPGSGRWIDPRSGSAVRIHAIDPEEGVLVVARRAGGPAPELTALVPAGPVPTQEHRARLHELAGWVLAHGVDSPLPQWRAARDLLLRTPPRTGGPGQRPGGPVRRHGEEAAETLVRVARALAADGAGGLLAVQGPPGTGKTHTGARAIVRLVEAGLRVGICAFSHKAIGNLIEQTCRAAQEAGVPLRGIRKADERGARANDAVPSTTDNAAVDVALAGGAVDLVAGTTWLFAREALAGAVDVLVVDEAGQLSLADVLAVSHAARCVVLLGDPQQLTQPVEGVHPPGAEASALEHLLDGRATLPPQHGVLLDRTFRMHPDVAAFVSRLSYEGRLGVAGGRERLCVEAEGALRGAGLRWVPVEHAGNTSASREEALVVRRLVGGLLAGGRWTDHEGVTHPLTPAEVLVLTPYNQQAHRVRRALADLPGGAGVLVGTVDKLQGRQAAVAVYTLATSSTADAPRGSDFLFSLNRLTVAVSRSRALTVVVASPALLLAPVPRPADLRRVNALAAYAASAEVVEVPPG